MPYDQTYDLCPHCNQRLRFLRNGIRVTPNMARIFDLVKKRPGIDSLEMAEIIYGVRSEKKAKVVRTRICEMNALFTETDIRIEGKAFYGYTIKNLAEHLNSNQERREQIGVGFSDRGRPGRGNLASESQKLGQTP